MSNNNDDLNALFAEAVRSQERLEEEIDTAADTTDATEGDTTTELDVDAAEEENVIEAAVQTDDASSKRKAQEAITEALIKAKQEAIQALEQTQKEAKSLRDRLLRVSADFENFRKRSRQQQDNTVKFANEGFMRELIPVLDNYDLAMAHVDTNDENPLIKGVMMVQQHLLTTLEKNGLKGFSALAQPFDPNLHEAVEQAITDEHPAGQVIREYQKGYTYQERLLRPAMVVVAMPPRQEPAPAADETTPESEESVADVAVEQANAEPESDSQHSDTQPQGAVADNGHDGGQEQNVSKASAETEVEVEAKDTN